MTTFQRLDGQVALVTGAGGEQGIGFAAARALADDGATVVLSSTTDRVHDRVAQLTELGHTAIGVIADLMEPGAAERVVAVALGPTGRLEICINNAGMTAVGIAAVDADIEGTTDSAWHDGIERNLTTCFAVTRAAVAAMRRQGYGRIVNIASTSGPVQAFHGDVAYHAAKAGMVGFTRAVALETAGHGITVNAVAPGWIASGSQLTREEGAGRLTAMGRSGTPQEIAAGIRFLADPAAGYVTGQLLVIDGGNSLPEDRSWQP